MISLQNSGKKLSRKV